MMKLSTKARYALRAMVELACREGKGPIQLREIAKAQALSPKYLEQLTISLRNAGLIRSERGPNGGYWLSRPAGQITALDVVSAAEGPVTLVECIAQSSVCERSAACAARRLWTKVSSAISDTLAEVTLADLREEQMAANSSQAFCYQI
jgi:Rrf2 family protein